MAAHSRSRSVTRAPARTIVIQGGKRAGAVARRVGGAAAAAARDEAHTITALLAAAALGYARRENMLANLPQIEAIGPEGSIALVAYALGKMTKSKIASHVATGLGAVAVNRMAAGDGTST